MEWVPNTNKLIIQQLNRKQNVSTLFIAEAQTATTTAIYKETDEAWVEFNNRSGESVGWDWLDNGKSFLWISEKDGWNHAYKITLDGKEQLLTPEILM
jgi:dipeptidyl-peptidase-4